MLYTTVELLAQASSNSHILFCFCNLIIILLLFGNFKSNSSQIHLDECRYTTTTPTFSGDPKKINTDDDAKPVKDDDNTKTIDHNEGDEDEEDESSNQNDINEDELETEKIGILEEEEEDDDDELRRKFEEFILKMKGQLRMEN